MILGDRAMKSPCVLAIGAICFAVLAVVVVTSAGAADDEQALLQVDRAAFKEGNVVSTAIGNLLDSNFTWTDASGVVRTKSQLMQDLKSRKELGTETEHGSGESASPSSSVTAHVYGEIGIVRENSGRTYTLRIWVKKMVSRQQPEHGLPLHVTRVWFKRNGMWLEAYSYQTTIQPATTPQ